MLSILPFERLNPKEQDRPFKAYSRPPVSLPSATGYYGPYQQNSYIPSSLGYSQRLGDTMDLPVRPPPAHSYDQNPHHLMDISHGASRMHNGIKADPDNMHYSMLPSMAIGHHGYGSSDMSPAMHMPQMPTSTNSHPMNRVSSSMSPSTTASTSSPESVEAGPVQNDAPETSTTSSISKMPPKKRPLSVPEDLKDGTYWEKRKKNNESAKRSREQRRCKEEQIAMRVVYLEQENLQLRTEVSLLKSEIDKLRCMLYNS